MKWRRLWRKRWLRLMFGSLLVTLVCIVVASFGGLRAESIEQLNPWAFFAAMAVLPVLGMPITPFFVIAGLRFGIVGGLALAAMATTFNLLLCYWVAHGRLRPKLRGLIARRFPALANLDVDRRGAWRLTLLVKLVPGVPLFVKHYALGVAGVPLSIYLAVALLTTAPYGTAFVVLGESALEGDVGQALMALGGLMLLAVVVLVWRSFRSRRSPV